MIVKNCLTDDINEALGLTNEIFDNNITYDKLPEYRGKRLYFTLRVKNLNKVGAKINISGRKSISACWHVHGIFLECLLNINPKAIILTYWGKGNLTIKKDKGGQVKNNWKDWNIGSFFKPRYVSNACNCSFEIYDKGKKKGINIK